MTQELELHKDFRVGVVIPVGPGEFRQKNLRIVMNSLDRTIFPFQEIVIVGDGWYDNTEEEITNEQGNAKVVITPKHEPGMEQPRNIGVRHLSDDVNYVWFLDSDCIVTEDTLHEFAKAAHLVEEERVLIGPYEWMQGGEKEPHPEQRNDPRWVSFDEFGPEKVFKHDLGVALACFSGNLIWPISEFKRVGGFWNDLHMGRCEDGELGLRAASMGVPMGLVKDARAYHMGGMGGHGDLFVAEKNSRDVPMINERHPWVEDEGLIVVDEDGKRFNQICPTCGESINTGEIWIHSRECI